MNHPSEQRYPNNIYWLSLEERPKTGFHVHLWLRACPSKACSFRVSGFRSFQHHPPTSRQGGKTAFKLLYGQGLRRQVEKESEGQNRKTPPGGGQARRSIAQKTSFSDPARGGSRLFLRPVPPFPGNAGGCALARSFDGCCCDQGRADSGVPGFDRGRLIFLSLPTPLGANEGGCCCVRENLRTSRGSGSAGVVGALRRFSAGCPVRVFPLRSGNAGTAAPSGKGRGAHQCAAGRNASLRRRAYNL